MGDIVHGLPAAAYLKKNLPDLELSWLVEPAGAFLLQGNPAVDRVIVFPKKKWLQQLRTVSRLGATAAEAGDFIADLKKLEFDAAIDLQGLLKSSVLAVLSGAKLRFGFKGTREGADRLLTHKYDCGDYFGKQPHVIQHNLGLAAFACKALQGLPSDTEGGSHSYIYDEPEFPLPPVPAESLEKAEKLLSVVRSQKRIIALIPGTTWETKIWPEESWTELAELCLSKTAGPLLMLGGPAEKAMNGRIAANFGELVLDLTGMTSISDLQAIYQMTDLVIGADSGPVHLAAAVGKPKVAAIFGSTPSGRNGPWGKQCASIGLSLECQPCFKKRCPLEIKTLACLKELSPAQVFAELDFD